MSGPLHIAYDLGASLAIMRGSLLTAFSYANHQYQMLPDSREVGAANTITVVMSLFSCFYVIFPFLRGQSQLGTSVIDLAM